MLVEMVGMVVMMVMAMSGVAVMLMKVIVYCIANGGGSGDGGGNGRSVGDGVLMAVAMVMVAAIALSMVVEVVGADRLGRTVCTRANTIDLAKDFTVLILVTNSIAKPRLERTCLGFAGAFVSQVRALHPGYAPLDYMRRNSMLHRPANQKASLMMVPAIGGTVNRKFASDLKGVICHGFELHDRCSGLIEGLQNSDHLDDENANQARISLSAT
ncbi:hypothetical protein PoB_004070700 [Plakobranchus ocellatus]|uniref:Uncharacterized protein n=1 Tax=Plakobranchus ocellatus TaxID=259542 RepID=A0AAV4B4S5_9GAST|nr:hypothetical protein PoB_004070700 [Plakobranchus ocellatus]